MRSGATADVQRDARASPRLETQKFNINIEAERRSPQCATRSPRSRQWQPPRVLRIWWIYGSNKREVLHWLRPSGGVKYVSEPAHLRALLSFWSSIVRGPSRFACRATCGQPIQLPSKIADRPEVRNFSFPDATALFCPHDLHTYTRLMHSEVRAASRRPRFRFTLLR